MYRYLLIFYIILISEYQTGIAQTLPSQNDSIQPLLNKKQNEAINKQRSSDSLFNAEENKKSANLDNKSKSDTTIRNSKGKLIKSSKEMFVKSQMEKAMTVPLNVPPEVEYHSNKAHTTTSKSIPIKRNTLMPNLNDWSEASRKAAEEITRKYGNPYSITENELVWINEGVWKEIRITKTETKHSFPFEHTDVLQTTIEYKVPIKSIRKLSEFDGSIIYDRTQGTLSARGDSEAHNFLELNLSNDIIKSKKSVSQARKAYGNILVAALHDKKPEYMQRLTFLPQENTADPDKTTIELNPQKVVKIIKN